MVFNNEHLGHHYWQRAVPLPRGSFPAIIPRYGVCRYPRNHLQLDHEVRRGYPKGPLRQHCPLRRHHHVPRHRRQNAKGNHRPCAIYDENQDHRAARTQILGLDRWLHPRLPLHVPTNVDLQARVRRIRTLHRPQKVLLNSLPGSFWTMFVAQKRPTAATHHQLYTTTTNNIYYRQHLQLLFFVLVNAVNNKKQMKNAEQIYHFLNKPIKALSDDTLVDGLFDSGRLNTVIDSTSLYMFCGQLSCDHRLIQVQLNLPFSIYFSKML